MNAIDSGRESDGPPSDPSGSHLPAGGLQAADTSTRGQCSDMNSKPDDFLYSLSQDGAGIAELQWADPDVSRVLD